MSEGCPYCPSHGFIADATHPADPLDATMKPDAVRWFNQCSACGCWSVWVPDEGQQKLPDPSTPSLE